MSEKNELDNYLLAVDNEIDESQYIQEISEEDKVVKLAEIGTLCTKAEDLEAKLNASKALVAEQQKALDELLKDKIPTLLESVGLKELKTTSGKKITVYDECAVNISENNRNNCMTWFRENGFDDIIKNNVVVTFRKGDDSNALKIYRDLLSKGFDVNHEEDVHPATLKAFMKERIRQGELSIEDKKLFGIFEYKITKIK
jgi:hypothetical protein